MLEHLLSRGMNPDLYPGMGYDDECAVFPLHNFGGQRTGSLYYRPDGAKKVQNDERGKYYTYITKGELGVLGLSSLERPGPILLVGGLFKAATLHRLGYASLHVSSVSPKPLRQQLHLLRRAFYALGDNDGEGETFVRRWGGLVCPRDVDEMSDLDVHRLVNSLRFNP